MLPTAKRRASLSAALRRSYADNVINLFDFKGHKVRNVMIDGEPWFVATDAYQILGLDRSSIRRLDDDEKTLLRRTQLGMKPGRDAAVVSEPGLYKLVLRSRKAEALEFQDWVTREVLPTIRKTGGYMLQGANRPT